MSSEKALSNILDNINQFIKSNNERTQVLEGERTCTRFLIERMNEDLVRLKMKSHDDDYATQLRMLHNKIDILTNKLNEIIVTLKHT